MDVKEAVALAKAHIFELFAGEGVEDIGLEEVEYTETGNIWRITIGFTRPWDRSGFLRSTRSYKVVNIAATGRVLSVKNRETSDA